MTYDYGRYEYALLVKTSSTCTAEPSCKWPMSVWLVGSPRRKVLLLQNSQRMSHDVQWIFLPCIMCIVLLRQCSPLEIPIYSNLSSVCPLQERVTKAKRRRHSARAPLPKIWRKSKCTIISTPRDLNPTPWELTSMPISRAQNSPPSWTAWSPAPTSPWPRSTVWSTCPLPCPWRSPTRLTGGIMDTWHPWRTRDHVAHAGLSLPWVLALTSIYHCLFSRLPTVYVKRLPFAPPKVHFSL